MFYFYQEVTPSLSPSGENSSVSLQHTETVHFERPDPEQKYDDGNPNDTGTAVPTEVSLRGNRLSTYATHG